MKKKIKSHQKTTPWPLTDLDMARAVWRAERRLPYNRDKPPNNSWDLKDWESLTDEDRRRAYDYYNTVNSMIDEGTSNSGPNRVVAGWAKGKTPFEIARLGDPDGPGWGQAAMKPHQWEWPFHYRDFWNEQLRWLIADCIWGPKASQYAENWKEHARVMWERAAKKWNKEREEEKLDAARWAAFQIIEQNPYVDHAQEVHEAYMAMANIDFPFDVRAHAKYYGNKKE